MYFSRFFTNHIDISFVLCYDLFTYPESKCRCKRKAVSYMTDSAKLDLLLSEIKEMKQDIHLLKDDTQKLKEEIRVNIQRVAEGHLDLSRNLHDAMRPSNEVEMLAIKVRMLESDVKELKSRLA